MADPAQQAIVGKLVEYLVDALKDQVSYLCCYSCNAPKLANEVGELNKKYEGVQLRVDAAQNNLETILPEVASWQRKVEKVQEDSKNIDAAAEQIVKSCLCKRFPVLHYSLSRDAVKTTESAIQLRKEVLPDPISIPRIAAEIDPVPHPSAEYKFRSRDEIEEKIMDALKDHTVYLIGLHGKGGIGKTTLAKKILGRAKKEKSIFEHVVMTTVSQQPDLLKIQDEIAKELGLELSGESSRDGRAKKLHERLKAEKGVLVILDDVWDILKLDDLGIPSQRNHDACKLILISRDKQNFNIIGNPKSEIFELGILKEEESWILFRDNAGDAIDSPDLIEIANDIVKKCNGLPLALEVVGCALRHKNKSYWETARTELLKSMPLNIEGVERRVYRPLMYSIERLESPDAKGLLLLCCLFPEDHKISLEELVRCGVGLRIIEDEELMEARKKVELVLDNLISRALLIKSIGCDTFRVQMHDVIRDVAIWIASKKKIESEERDASKEKHVFMVSHGKKMSHPMREEESYGCYTGISLKDVKIPEFMDCPRLELLHIHCGYDFVNIPQNFFSRMGSLRVLEASIFSLVPSSVRLLENLRTLYLHHCGMEEMAYVIGDLTNLEILRLKSCWVDVLPKEIGGLKKLRRLDILRCGGLRIAFGVISGLLQLEELVILDSFENWEAQAIETTNASLVELDSLNHLTTLMIQIKNRSVIPTERPHWVRNLKKYSISVSKSAWEVSRFHSRFHKAVTCEYGDTPSRDWLCVIVSDAEYLDLAGSSYFKAISSNRKSLKFLSLSRLTDVQYLADGQQNGAIFPMLESLRIQDSCSLLDIFKGPPPVGSLAALEKMELRGLSELRNVWEFSTGKLYLSNLKSLMIHSCEKLGYLFFSSIAQSLSCLEELEVSNCPRMEEIFKKKDGEMEIKKLEFPKLQRLILESMESLRRFYKGVDRIEISGCFFEQQFAGNFSGLQNLSVKSIHKLKCLFSPSIPSGFSNLEELKIEDCSELEEVIGKDENVEKTAIFPKLKNLYLINLPRIITFCYAAIKFPSLKYLHIEMCPMMEEFSQGLPNISNSRFDLSFFSIEVYCPKLERMRLWKLNSIANIFSPPAFSALTNLKYLYVGSCKELEEVIGKEEAEDILSPPLKALGLRDLPNIHTFCHRKHCLKFSSLGRASIINCPMLERFFLEPLNLPNFTLMDGLLDANLAAKVFFNKEVYCPKLERMTLEELNSIANIFSPPAFSVLTNLKYLYVESCKELEEVIGKEEAEDILSPPLEVLELHDLPKIHRFCSIKHSLKFPSLEEVRIIDCPVMERFSLGPLHLPNLTLVDGLLDANFAAKFFFNKEISSCQSHLEENDYFTIFVREISLSFGGSRGPELKWFVTPRSSESFAEALQIIYTDEIIGKFETTKLLAGLAYEVVLIVMYPVYVEWPERIEIGLTLSGGVTQQRTVILNNLPRNKWIEISLGNIRREPHQNGQLELVFRRLGYAHTRLTTCIKGVRITKV